MSPDSFTETTRHGWGGRLSSSLKGAIVGLLLFLISFPLLWTNEGRAVHRAQTLKMGRDAVTSIAGERVDEALEGALVHITGTAATSDQLTDTAFNIVIQAIKLLRTVEMYQWVEEVHTEKETKTGGSEDVTKTYTYEPAWRESLEDSSSFRIPEGHTNPNSMPYRSAELTAEEVRLGAFRLSESLVSRISGTEPIPVTAEILAAMPADVRDQATLHNRGIYVGGSPATPQVGDIRIQFDQVPPQPVSAIGRQTGDRIERYPMKKGSIEMLRAGELAPDAMFDLAEQENKILTWILRGVGCLLMSIGLASVFGPLAVATDIVPFLGRLSRAGINLLSGVISIALSLLVIAAAWIAYRPLLGLALLGLAVLALVGLKSLSKDKYQAIPSPPPPPPPPPPPSPA